MLLAKFQSSNLETPRMEKTLLIVDKFQIVDQINLKTKKNKNRNKFNLILQKN